MKSGEMPSAYAMIHPHTTPIRVAMDCKNPLAFRLITKITAVVTRKTIRNLGWMDLYPEEIPVAPFITVELICITMRIRKVPFTMGVNTLRILSASPVRATMITMIPAMIIPSSILVRKTARSCPKEVQVSARMIRSPIHSPAGPSIIG